MNQNLFSPLINLCILLIFFLIPSAESSSSSSAVDPSYQVCSAPKTCGNLNISYPFFIQGWQKSFCGYPGFNLSCHENQYPILQVFGNDYIIRNINYQSQSLVVSNAVFSDFHKSSACSNIPLVHNVSFPNDRFNLAQNQTELVLLYNCNSSLVESLSEYKIGCFKGINKNSSVLALPRGDVQFGNALDKCGRDQLVVAPLQSYGNGSGVGMEEVLRRGFVLNWLAGNCNRCENSGGRCGFNYTTYHFMCLCPDRPHFVQCRNTVKHAVKKIFKLKLVLGVGLGGAALLVGCLFILRRYKKKGLFLSRNISSQPYSNSDIEGGSAYYGVPVFTYNELEEATNHFNSERELGDGGFGTVYHGKLKDGREVAVKRLYEHNYKRVEQFMNEIEILTQLRHTNLVSLYGCTSRRSRDLLLVYEYIPNGTVADHLHGDRADHGSLTWPIRMSIAIETASALSYLHASDIVHRDVKTNNILLDNNFCVKVADFGLSRIFPTDVTHVSTAPQGTPGYVDPEYHQCYQLTSKSDVYSFGVVLIELISSMPAVDISRHRHEINLANLAMKKIQKGLFNELVDPSIGFESDNEVRRMTIAVAELAFQCLQQENDMRPTMNEVVEALKIIESGDDVPETLKRAMSIQPPPSADCDEVGLLKHPKPPPSPNSVTQQWPSTRSTTPNASG